MFLFIGIAIGALAVPNGGAVNERFTMNFSSITKAETRELMRSGEVRLPEPQAKKILSALKKEQPKVLV